MLLLLLLVLPLLLCFSPTEEDEEDVTAAEKASLAADRTLEVADTRLVKIWGVCLLSLALAMKSLVISSRRVRLVLIIFPLKSGAYIDARSELITIICY